MNFYIIEEKETNICKIGVSNDIEERLKRLQTGNSSELVLNSGFYCKIPYKLETCVKNKYKESNRVGEWYDVEDKAELIEFINRKSHELNNKYYTCNLCDFKTIYKTGYKRHLKTNKHNKREGGFINRDKMIDLIEIIHGDKDLLFKCNKCEKEFKRKWDLERHLNKKNPCKKIIQDIQKNDELIEKDEKPYGCDFCKRSYKHKYHMNRHLKTCKEKQKEEQKEKDEKPYGCDFCKRSYKHKYNLTKHLKTCKEKQKEEQKEKDEKQQEFDLVNSKIRLLELEKQKEEQKDEKQQELDLEKQKQKQELELDLVNAKIRLLEFMIANNI
tara:strand:- start:2446 stop:3429 length:984 start_codon:yes stop_codon:yes gene_type:complete